MNETMESEFYGTLRLCLYSNKSYILQWNDTKWPLFVNVDGVEQHNSVCRAIWAHLSTSDRALDKAEILALRSRLRQEAEQASVEEPPPGDEAASAELHTHMMDLPSWWDE